MQGPPCPFELGWGAVPIFGAQCHVIFDVLVLCDSYKPVRGTLVPLNDKDIHKLEGEGQANGRSGTQSKCVWPHSYLGYNYRVNP